MAHREPTDWVNRTLETDTCWKEVSFRKGKVSKGWLLAAFVLSRQSPFSWEEVTDSLLLWPQEGILHYVCRVWLVEAKRFEHVWLYFCIPGSLGHWGGRQGWFHRNSVAQLSSGKSWKFCLSASCWEHSWATESPFHLLPGLFLGSEPPCGLSSQRDF